MNAVFDVPGKAFSAPACISFGIFFQPTSWADYAYPLDIADYLSMVRYPVRGKFFDETAGKLPAFAAMVKPLGPGAIFDVAFPAFIVSPAATTFFEWFILKRIIFYWHRRQVFPFLFRRRHLETAGPAIKAAVSKVIQIIHGSRLLNRCNR